MDDQIIVVDDGNERIHFFDSEGVPLRTFSAASAAVITALAQQGGGQQHTQTTGSAPGIHAAPAQPESRPDAHGTLGGSNNNNAARVQPPQAGAAAAGPATESSGIQSFFILIIWENLPFNVKILLDIIFLFTHFAVTN